jgi:hypothetical protein
LLEKGEAVLTQKQQSATYKIIDFSTHMLEKFGALADKIQAPQLKGGIFDMFGDFMNKQRSLAEYVQNNNVSMGGVAINVVVNGNIDAYEARAIGDNIGEGMISKMLGSGAFMKNTNNSFSGGFGLFGALA